MTIKKAVANALGFASLLGRAEAAKADDDEETKDAAKAESDDEKDEKDDDDKEKSKSKKAKAEDDPDKGDNDDGNEDEKNDTKAAKAAVAADRKRCAAIVAHGLNVGAVRQACVYAFDTDMSAETAIATIDATAADRKTAAAALSLGDRMAANPVPAARADAPGKTDPSDPKAFGQSITAAMKIARGEA